MQRVSQVIGSQPDNRRPDHTSRERDACTLDGDEHQHSQVAKCRNEMCKIPIPSSPRLEITRNSPMAVPPPQSVVLCFWQEGRVLLEQVRGDREEPLFKSMTSAYFTLSSVHAVY